MVDSSTIIASKVSQTQTLSNLQLKFRMLLYEYVDFVTVSSIKLDKPIGV